MLDILSIVLAAIGILQNQEKKVTREERLLALAGALDQISSVHNCLAEAKEIHDQFEKLTLLSIRTDFLGIERNRDDRKIVLEHMKNFVSANQTIVRNRSISVDIGSDHDFTNLPIQREADRLFELYPELQNSLLEYFKSVEVMEGLIEEEDTGKKLSTLITVIPAQVSRISANADDVIFNIVPITQFLQYELRRYVNDLLESN